MSSQLEEMDWGEPKTQLVASHPLNGGEESTQSKMHRRDVHKQLEWHKEQGKRRAHWDSMESGRKARVEALARLMSGEKPPKRVEAEIEHKRVGRQAKAALRGFVNWARDHKGALDKGQRKALSELIAAWNEIRVAGAEVDEPDADGLEPRAAPPHATLKRLHGEVARRGAGAGLGLDAWRRYLDRSGTLVRHTDRAY